jgi:hypothetical protein
MNMNISQRYIKVGTVAALIAIGLVVGAIRPHKSAQAAPRVTPEVKVTSVEEEELTVTFPGS